MKYFVLCDKFPWFMASFGVCWIFCCSHVKGQVFLKPFPRQLFCSVWVARASPALIMEGQWPQPVSGYPGETRRQVSQDNVQSHSMQWLKPLPSKCLPCKVSPSLWAWCFSPRGFLLLFWWPDHRSAPWFPSSSSLFSFRALHRFSSACLLCCLPVCAHRELHPTHSPAPSQLCPRRLICKTQHKRTPSTPAISKVWHQGRSAIIKPYYSFSEGIQTTHFKKFFTKPSHCDLKAQRAMNELWHWSLSLRSFPFFFFPFGCAHSMWKHSSPAGD